MTEKKTQHLLEPVQEKEVPLPRRHHQIQRPVWRECHHPAAQLIAQTLTTVMATKRLQ